MSERDLIQELKSTIKDLSDEKEDLLKTINQKESRIKTVMIKLEHATQDVSSVGHKIAEKDKEIAKLDFMIPDAMTMTRYEFIEKYVDDKYETLQLLLYWNIINDCFDVREQAKDIETEWVKESYGGTDPD